jgi:hypothetical protein
MEIIKAILIGVVILVLIGILYNTSRFYHKLYTITYRSTKNPLWRSIKSIFRSLVFALMHFDGSVVIGTDDEDSSSSD